MTTFAIGNDEEDEYECDDELLKENEKLRENIKKVMNQYPKYIIYKKIKENKCSICLSNYKYSEKLVLTTCLHLFHRDCIDKSIETNINCPECRFDLNNTAFLYLEEKLEITGTEFIN